MRAVFVNRFHLLLQADVVTVCDYVVT